MLRWVCQWDQVGVPVMTSLCVCSDEGVFGVIRWVCQLDQVGVPVKTSLCVCSDEGACLV